MRMKSSHVLLAGGILLVVALVPAASWGAINYGSFMGTNVTYVDVTEDPGVLFGPPMVTGNSIDFNPVGFDAASTGANSELTIGNLAFMVVAKPGARIQSFMLADMGDTTMAGNVAPGSMGTATAVFASGVLDIQEVDFAPINHISVPFSLSFSPSGGTYFLGTDGGGGPMFHTPWTGSATLDIEAILMANGVTGGATKISIDLNNTLSAVSQAGTSAQIAKKDFGGTIIIMPVEGDIPEPGSVALLGAAVVLTVRRRRGIHHAVC